MGFDPMTHRPRTDLFSSLPHLMALINLRELMDHHHPWEEQAVRLQAEAVQLARLQSLQYLLQTAALMTPNSASNSLNNITDMEAFNLLNSIASIKENPVLNSSHLENPTLFSLGIATTQAVQDPIPFSHLPDLQVPCSFQTPLNGTEMGQVSNFTVLSQGEYTPKSSYVPPSSSSSPPPAPPVTETSFGNLGDACSTSSYGGGTAPFWPELLFEDPFVHEIA